MAIMATRILAHHINRLSLNIQTVDQQAALRYRKQLYQQWPDLLTVLESAFEMINVENQWIHIPRVELNLGAVSDGDLARLPQLVQQALAEQLQSYGFSISSQQPGHALKATDKQRHAGLLNNEQSSVYEPLTVFLFYLQTGRLPWFMTSSGDLEELVEQISDAIPALAEYLWHHGTALYYLRVIMLLSDQQVKTIAQHHVTGNENRQGLEWQKTVSTVIDFLQQHIHALDRSLNLQAQLLALLARPTRKQLMPSDLPDELDKLSSGEWQSLKKLLPDNFTSLVEASTLAPFFDNAIPTEQVRQSSTNSEAITSASQQQTDVVPTEESALLVQQVQQLIEKNAAVNLHSVPMAGLVLTHAYLPRLFKALAIDPRTFSQNKKMLKQAVAILNFIASGTDNPQEHQMELIKILLGQPVDQALVMTQGLLVPEDKQEIEAMLTALIRHWPALKNTSVTGLQQAFLMREGYVKKTDQGWLLTLERKGFDVLLDAFPFSFAVVKLPWMPESIQVEW
jgi:hypothetical protein